MTTNAPPDVPLGQIPHRLRRLPLFTFLVFEQVLRSGGFAAAAEQLGVTTSTVSKHVVRLEDVAGRTLTLRDPVVPTPAGQAVREIASQVVALACELADAAEEWR